VVVRGQMEDVEPGREKRRQIEAQFLENLQASGINQIKYLHLF
jgi:hypothetical protein